MVAVRIRSTGDLARAVTGIAGLMLSGCTSRGAPSFSLFGAFFPAWMFCAIVGIAVAIGTRVAIGAFRSANELPPPLVLCAAVGAICAALLWLVWFGR